MVWTRRPDRCGQFAPAFVEPYGALVVDGDRIVLVIRAHGANGVADYIEARVVGGHEKEQYRQSSLRGRCLVVCRFIIEFEFRRCLRLAGRILLICERKPELDAVLTEEITHGPALDSSKPRGITERDPLAFVAGDRSCNALVFVFSELFTHEISQRIARATKHTSLDSTLDEEIEIVWIGAGDSSHPAIRTYVFRRSMNVV